jgi:hypothetical protein
MSPQMNGEPREATSADVHATRSQNSDAEQTSQPLPPALNTQGVTKTVVKEESDLAPLFESGAAAEFRTRWDLVQRSFVDDPKKAVQAADELVAQVTRTLTDSFVDQRSEREKRFDQAQPPTTESLRIALRQYRAFFERLLSL